jgi:hypothetical protein
MASVAGAGVIDGLLLRVDADDTVTGERAFAQGGLRDTRRVLPQVWKPRLFSGLPLDPEG